jgi:hypothetical protein
MGGEMHGTQQNSSNRAKEPNPRNIEVEWMHWHIEVSKCFQRGTELNPKNAQLMYVFLLTWVVRLVIVNNKHILSRVGYLPIDINH